MATYLVTGGCGFIGSHLVDALCRDGHRVRILDDLSTGRLCNKPPDVDLIHADVAEPQTVKAALEGVDGCFHLAAVASVDRANTDWLGTHRTNLSGTIAVLDAARRRRHAPIPVVFASSAAVYGDNPDLPLSETTVPRPLSAYGADKLGCELHGAVARRVHQIPNCGLRFFNVYGPRQDPDSPYSGVISIFCDRIKTGRPITLYGDGTQTRDFIYVADVVLALISAMNDGAHSDGVLNICTGTAVAICDLAKLVGDILGRPPDIEFMPPRQGDIRHSLGNPDRAYRSLGFRASTGLTAGLIKTVDTA